MIDSIFNAKTNDKKLYFYIMNSFNGLKSLYMRVLATMPANSRYARPLHKYIEVCSQIEN